MASLASVASWRLCFLAMPETPTATDSISIAPAFLLCPGQGAQHVGMGEAWFDRYPVAAQTFAAADRELGVELSTLCFNGPQERLDRTDIAQAAIYTTSVACYQALVEMGEVAAPGATAGLSLGEFTALHLAGAFDFIDGLKLVRLRGQAMQDAAEEHPGTMTALTGDVSESAVLQLCDEARGDDPDAVLVPANFNSPMQVVISGTVDANERAVPIAERMGFKATRLQVAGAFHSPLMRSAGERLGEALEAVDWAEPRVPVLSNVTGEFHDIEDIASIKRLLVEQLTSPVRWSQSMHHALAAAPSDNPPRFIELAPGRVLSGLMRRIERGAKVENRSEPGG